MQENQLPCSECGKRSFTVDGTGACYICRGQFLVPTTAAAKEEIGMQIGHCRECQIDLSSAPSATAGDQTLCAACDWAGAKNEADRAKRREINRPLCSECGKRSYPVIGTSVCYTCAKAGKSTGSKSLKELFLDKVGVWEYAAKLSIAENKRLAQFERFDPELIAARRKVHEAVQAAAVIIAKRKEGR